MENQLETERMPNEVQDSEVNFSNGGNSLEEGNLSDGVTAQTTENLILGKFKNVEDLANAYSELQKLQGVNSQELGELRKTAGSYNSLADNLMNIMGFKDGMADYISQFRTKYDTPEYFQDSTFRDMYKEAYLALGNDLDTDKFIDLLEKYVCSRITSYDKSKAAKIETQNALDSMNYSKNPKSAYTPPKKHFSQMTQAEIDEMLDRLL